MKALLIFYGSNKILVSSCAVLRRLHLWIWEMDDFDSNEDIKYDNNLKNIVNLLNYYVAKIKNESNIFSSFINCGWTQEKALGKLLESKEENANKDMIKEIKDK